MPNYVAAREYYKKILQHNSTEDVIYFIPSTTYHYDHPDGTGKDTPPFESLWFIGVSIQREWKQDWPGGRLVSSLEDLSKSTAAFRIIFQKRPNPKQRRKKLTKTLMEQEDHTSHQSEKNSMKTKGFSYSVKPSKRSKYRDESGNRKKGRF